MLEHIVLQLLAQILNIDATYVVGGLWVVINFFAVLMLKDIRSSLKELHTLYMEHDRDITTLKAERTVRQKGKT